MTTFPSGCYGKLPIFADFIRHNAHGPEVQTLDQWFQEGIYLARQTLGARWDAGYDRAPATRFVFRPAGAPRFLVGVSVAGTDKSGRKYPFSIFLTVDAAPFERDAALLPLVFGPFLEEAQDLATKGWIGGDARQLIAKVDALKTREIGAVDAARGGYDGFLRGEKAAGFWPDIFGSFEHVGKYLLLQDLKDAVATIRNAPLGRPSLGLKFPLPASLDAQASGFETTFWLDLAMRLLGRPAVPPLMFWNQRGTSEDPSLFVFFSTPSPRSFLALIQPGQESDHIWALGRGEASQAEKVRDRLSPALENPDLSLAEMIAKVSP